MVDEAANQGENSQEIEENKTASIECEENSKESNVLSDAVAVEKQGTSEDSKESKNVSDNDFDNTFFKHHVDVQARIAALAEERLAENHQRDQEQREEQKAAHEFSSEKVFKRKFLEPIRDDNGDIIGYKNPVHIGHLDLKVGMALKVSRHPKPSKQCRYVETVAIRPEIKGSKNVYLAEDLEKMKEERSLEVESGLPRCYSIDDISKQNLIVLCNPKPFTKRGVESKVVVLCAKKDDKIELLQAPKKAVLGSSIYAKGYAKNPQKPYVVNVAELIENDLRVNNEKQVLYKDKPLQVEGIEGFVTTQTLSDCSVSNVMGYDFI